jgi:hypothetical protein
MAWSPVRSSILAIVLISFSGSTSESPVREKPVRKPVTQIRVECILPKGQMGVINNMEATSRRYGIDGEKLYQYQVCFEV